MTRKQKIFMIVIVVIIILLAFILTVFLKKQKQNIPSKRLLQSEQFTVASTSFPETIKHFGLTFLKIF